MIPRQLQNLAFRFIPLGSNGKYLKRPVEKWKQDNKIYSWDDPVLENYVAKGHNIGVLGGYGNLGILDIDTREKFTELVITRKLDHADFIIRTHRGYHVYFLCPDIDSYKVEGIEVIGKGKYVVCPSSKHISGGTYEIQLDGDIPIWDKQLLAHPKMVSSIFPIVPNSDTRKQFLRTYKQTYVHKDDKLDLSNLAGKSVIARIVAVTPPLSYNEYKPRVTAVFLIEGKIYWNELNRSNEYELYRNFGHNPYYWLNNEVELTANPNSDKNAQSNTYHLVVAVKNNKGKRTNQFFGV